MDLTLDQIAEAFDKSAPFDRKDDLLALLEVYEDDIQQGEFDTEAEAVADLISSLLIDQDAIEALLQASQANMRWIVIVRLDGAETIVASQERRAASKKEAETEFLAYLRERDEGEYKLEYTYGPY